MERPVCVGNRRVREARQLPAREGLPALRPSGRPQGPLPGRDPGGTAWVGRKGRHLGSYLRCSIWVLNQPLTYMKRHEENVTLTERSGPLSVITLTTQSSWSWEPLLVNPAALVPYPSSLILFTHFIGHYTRRCYRPRTSMVNKTDMACHLQGLESSSGERLTGNPHRDVQSQLRSPSHSASRSCLSKTGLH